jgi:hypothetical protein
MIGQGQEWLCPIFVLRRFCSIRSIKSKANLGANSTKLFLTEPYGSENKANSFLAIAKKTTLYLWPVAAPLLILICGVALAHFCLGAQLRGLKWINADAR